MSGRVVVVGSVNVDLVVRVPRLPRPGETVAGGTFERHHGGKGANQAVAAARLGARVSFVGLVGDDDIGNEARVALAAEGVDVAELGAAPSVATGVAAILVDQAGENVIAVAGGANQALGADGVRRALGRLALAQDDVVLVSNEVPTEAVRAALDAARGVGARSILNPAPADGIDRAILALADVATPNRSEVVALLRSLHEATDGGAEGPPAPADAASLLASVEGSEATGSAILVTLGPNGALLVTRGPGGTVREHPVAAPGVVAVDATGAGDAFNGCLAASLADGSSLETAAARAVVAGALATTAVGARTAMPRRAALEESVAAFAGGGAIARTQPTT